MRFVLTVVHWTQRQNREGARERMICKVNGREIALFKIRQVSKTLGMTNEGIRKKEERGMVPPAIFRTPLGSRLYSPEEVAMFDYFFKTLWTKHQGVKLPDEVRSASIQAFNIVRKEVIEKGKVDNADILNPVHEVYEKFIPGHAMAHILHWRHILLGEEEEEDVQDEFDVQEFLENF